MIKFIGSPKYDNLKPNEFEAWMEWFIRQGPSLTSNMHRGMYILQDGGKLEYVNIHQLLEWWYYEISGFGLESKENQ